MPRRNYHLFEFKRTAKSRLKVRYTDTEVYKEIAKKNNTRPHTLEDVLRRPQDQLGYEYDFGDSRKHLIRLEEIVFDLYAYPVTPILLTLMEHAFQKIAVEVVVLSLYSMS